MTTDNLDIATERSELFLANALRQRKPEGPLATGTCLFCDEPTAPGQRWCNADHRDGWQKEQRR